MDLMAQERYRQALIKSMATCPCRWWLQRYMVLEPVNHDQRYYRPGEKIDGWQMATLDIASLLSCGSLGVVDMRPTGISGSVEEALAQAKRLRSLAPADNTQMGTAMAAYYGYTDKHHFRVWYAEHSKMFVIHNWDVVSEEKATRHASLTEVEMELAFTHLISPKEGWRPCFNRNRSTP